MVKFGGELELGRWRPAAWSRFADPTATRAFNWISRLPNVVHAVRLAGDAVALASLTLVAIHLGNVAPAGDAAAYYEARGGDLYGHLLGEPGFAYSPAFAQAIGPLQTLDFDSFRALVAAAELFALAYLVGPLLAVGLVAFQVWPVWEAIFHGGNLLIFTAAALVVALRNPVAWPLLFLTKVTPGIGILWPLLRREWRNVAIGVATTLAIAAISFVFRPDQWFGWVAWMANSVDVSPDRPGISFFVRVAIAVLVIGYAARKDRVWLVPVAAAMAAPEGASHWLTLLAVWPLWRSKSSLSTKHAS